MMKASWWPFYIIMGCFLIIKKISSREHTMPFSKKLIQNGFQSLVVWWEFFFETKSLTENCGWQSSRDDGLPDEKLSQNPKHKIKQINKTETKKTHSWKRHFGDDRMLKLLDKRWQAEFFSSSSRIDRFSFVRHMMTGLVVIYKIYSRTKFTEWVVCATKQSKKKWQIFFKKRPSFLGWFSWPKIFKTNTPMVYEHTSAFDQSSILNVEMPKISANESERRRS